MIADSIVRAVSKVTDPWAKQRKREERDKRALARRRSYPALESFVGIADKILPNAYKHASGNGQYPVSQRQLYYACRAEFKARVGKDLEYGYFSQNILRQYLNRYDVDWRITADPRGTFVIPNSSHAERIPVGTLPIDRYLSRRLAKAGGIDELNPTLAIQWPSRAERQRYAAVLYIEKEGFEPLIQEARIAERFDLAILSCKGQSVVAARKLVDQICAKDHGVPLFVVHDFDKAGFEIAHCLTSTSSLARSTDRVAYEFENIIDVTDFGLRLKDVEQYSLEAESCKVPAELPRSLPAAERKFLGSGQRVELNAFTAPQFIEWLESKLRQHLPDRLIPDDEVLEPAYRRALAVSEINRGIADIRDEAVQQAQSAEIPASLRDDLRSEMESTDEPWDVALHRLIEEDSEE